MLVRTITLASLSCLSLVACGSEGSTKPPDAPVKDIGFNKPTASLKANNEVSADNWVELGPADLTCLGMPSADAATTVEVTVTATVKDFESGKTTNTGGSLVTVFPGANVNEPFDPAKAADDMANISLRIPVGTKRFGYKMTNASSLDTLLLNQIVQPDMATQAVGAIQTVSKSTATLLPAIIGRSRTPGTGVLAGSLRDCKGDEMSNFIATVSKTKGTVDIIDGADSYYFSASVGLPVKHNQAAAATGNGLFMVIELPTAASAFVQVWGYKTDADMASDTLSLIAELPTPVIADTVITGSYEPLRQ